MAKSNGTAVKFTCSSYISPVVLHEGSKTLFYVAFCFGRTAFT